MRFLVSNSVAALSTLVVVVVCAGCGQESTSINLAEATIVFTGNEVPIAATVLAAEVEKRTGLSWPLSGDAVNGTSTTITLSLIRDAGITSEGYRAGFTDDGGSVMIEAADERGLLYGVGYLLRTLEWGDGKARLPITWGKTSAPVYAVRGHELGHRPLSNTYDYWMPEQYEQYIRELALFGVNTIQNTHHQMNEPGPMLRVPQAEMHVALSRICRKYGIDYVPFMPIEADLSDKAQRAPILEEFEEHIRAAPYISAIYVPGGDPGSNHPRDLLPVMEELSRILKRYHPDATIWTCLSKFEPDKVEYFMDYVNRVQPEWLAGVFHGPWGPSVAELRQRLPARYPIRLYPDETHNCRSQFPVPWWDPALEATLGREASNPRPVHYAGIARAYLPGTQGSVGYSDGVHDDVNKTIWNAITWDPETDVRDALVDYSRLFFGPKVAERAADGILALEQNWTGSLVGNGSVEGTLAFWQRLDSDHPELADNWRWQLLLLRANYDAFVRRKLIHERTLETEACAALATAPELGSEAVMERATAILASVDSTSVGAELRRRIVELCDDLFQTIGIQTSVEKYGAHGRTRGAVLDYLDVPLNNRPWLLKEMDAVRAMDSEAERVARLVVLGTWERPGPGSFYDDVGNVANSPHILRGEGIVTDPMLDRTPFPFFWDGRMTTPRTSWISSIHWPTLVYRQLDPDARYTVRLIADGAIAMRLDGSRVEATVDAMTRESFRLYDVPAEALTNGVLEITFDDVDAGNIHWREYSRVNEVWLLKD